MQLLKDDWKQKIKFDFGDTKEKLRKFLLYESGSILLSGDRGAGKTTLVKEVAEELEGECDFIWFNALHIEVTKEGGNELEMLHLLKLIVYSLDSQLKMKWCDCSNKRKLKKIKKELHKIERIVIGNVGGSMSIPKLPQGELSIGKSVQERWAGYDTLRLVNDLSSLLESLDGKKNLVFVLDELDKYSSKDMQKEFFRFIKSFKNMFTSSAVTFIFIADPEIYYQVNGTSGFWHLSDENRTLFTGAIFLKRNRFESLKGDIQKAFPKLSDIEADYLATASCGNPFNLHRIISSRIIIVKGRMYLTFEDLKEDFLIVSANLRNVGELVIDDEGLVDLFSQDIAYSVLWIILNNHWESNMYGVSSEGRGSGMKTLIDSLKARYPIHTDLIDKIYNEVIKTLSASVKGVQVADEENNIRWLEVYQEIEALKQIDSLRGAISPKERDFKTRLSTVKSNIVSIFQFDTWDNEKALRELGVDDAMIKLWERAELELGKLRADKDPQVFDEALESIYKIESRFSKYRRYQTNLLLRKDTDFIDFDTEGKGLVTLRYNDSAPDNLPSRLYIHSFPTGNNFSFEADVKSPSEEAILDFLLYTTEYLVNDMQDSFYVARLDTRKDASESIRNGFLRKRHNQKVREWDFVNTGFIRKTMKTIDSEVAYTVKIEKKGKKLSLKIKERDNNKFILIEEIEIKEEIFHLAVTNELNSFRIMDMRLS